MNKRSSTVTYLPGVAPVDRGKLHRLADKYIREVEKKKYRDVLPEDRSVLKRPRKESSSDSFDEDDLRSEPPVQEKVVDESQYEYRGYGGFGAMDMDMEPFGFGTSPFPSVQEIDQYYANKRRRERKAGMTQAKAEEVAHQCDNRPLKRSMSQSSDEVQIIDCKPAKQSATTSGRASTEFQRAKPSRSSTRFSAAPQLPHLQLKNSAIRSAGTAVVSEPLPLLLSSPKNGNTTDEQFANFIKRKVSDENQAELAHYDDEPEVDGFVVSATGSEMCFTGSHGEKERIIAKCQLNDAFKNLPAWKTPIPLPQIEVDIIKPNSTLRIKLALYAGSNEKEVLFKIESYNVLDDTDSMSYIPPAASLDVHIYDRLIKYLDERNINLKFCHDVVNFCIYYEHQVYTEHLNSLQKFLLK